VIPQAVRIAPSILTADFGRLADQARAAEEGGADLFHLDIMDGHFVPQLSFGAEVVAAVRQATTVPIEAHMMVARPEEHFESLSRAGAQIIPSRVAGRRIGAHRSGARAGMPRGGRD
jgi:ribulose-phosphate 3-epimerase